MRLSRGRITIDGEDIANVSEDQLHQCVHVVSQDPLLLPETIRQNIDPSDNVSDAAIEEIVARLGLTPFISSQGGIGSNMNASAWSSGQK